MIDNMMSIGDGLLEAEASLKELRTCCELPDPPDAPLKENERISQGWQDWQANLKDRRTKHLKNISKEMRLEENKRKRHRMQSQIRKLFAEKCKQANKIINGGSSNSQIMSLSNEATNEAVTRLPMRP